MNFRKFLFLPCVLSLLISCAGGPPSSGNRHPASTLNLKSSLLDVRKRLDRGISDHQECFVLAEQKYQELFDLTPEKASIQNLTQSELWEILKATFESKLIMRKYLGNLDISRPFGSKCYHAVRDLMRAIRYAEDYVIEHNTLSSVKTPAELKNKKFTTLKDAGLHFIRNSKYNFGGFQDLQSGDVILSRGNAYTSAAIARIGEDDAQFSHVSFVYKDPQGKLWTTEAHIEIGSVVAPIQTHIDQENARTVVFRYKDQELAHRASEYVFKLVQEQMKKGKNVPYDFGMDYKDSSELFCSEVVSKGMRDIGGVDVPKY